MIPLAAQAVLDHLQQINHIEQLPDGQWIHIGARPPYIYSSGIVTSRIAHIQFIYYLSSEQKVQPQKLKGVMMASIVLFREYLEINYLDQFRHNSGILRQIHYSDPSLMEMLNKFTNTIVRNARIHRSQNDQ